MINTLWKMLMILTVIESSLGYRPSALDYYKRTGQFHFVMNRFAYNLWRIGKSTNQFGVNLMKNMNELNNGSVTVAPFPVAYNLAAMTVSATGQTFDEICYVLNIHSFNINEIHWLFPEMCNLIRNDINSMASKQGIDYNITAVNAIYSDGDNSLYTNYKSHLKTKYNIPIIETNFTSSEEVATMINEEMTKETNGQIENFIEEPYKISENTSMLFVIGATFQGLFKPNEAEKSGEQITLKGTFGYAEDDFLMSQAIKIPLKGNENTLVIIQPKKMEDMDFVQKRLSGDYLAILVKRSMKSIKMEITLPEIDFTSPLYSLKDALGKDGLVDIFNMEKSALGQISRNGKAYVSDILHKVKISIGVSEDKNMMDATMRRSRQYDFNTLDFNTQYYDRQADSPVKKMELANPFWFFIVDTRTEMILFAGKQDASTGNPIELNTITVVGQGTTLDNEILTNGLTEASTDFIPTNGNTSPAAIVTEAPTTVFTETSSTETSKASTPESTTIKATTTSLTTAQTQSTTETTQPTPLVALTATSDESANLPTEGLDTRAILLNDIYKQTSLHVKNNEPFTQSKQDTSIKKRLHNVKGVGHVQFFKL